MGYRLDGLSERGTGVLASSANTIASPLRVSPEEYKRFCTYLEKHSGIVLGENKEYLILSRLRAVQEDFKLGSFAEILRDLEMGSSRELKIRVIDAMTTNETLWFRDSHPFDILTQHILPEIAPRVGRRPLRIWSAAASTGQEAYSISITLKEYQSKHPGAFPTDYEILATDLCRRAVTQAKAGRYAHYEIARGLSDYQQKRYFKRIEDVSVVNDQIKHHVRFQELNLLQSYNLLGQFDVIFLRNVLIYFSNELKTDILKRMTRALHPGGYLFLGGSEPIANYSDDFEMIRCPQGVVYQLKAPEQGS